MTSVWWWCAAGALTVVSAAMYGGQMAILITANPTARLPWIGWPSNAPRSAKVLGFFALLLAITAMDCGFEAQGRRHLYDYLWILPFWLVVLVVMAVQQAGHNRRVRRAD